MYTPMIGDLTIVLTYAAAIGCGVVGGIFYAFSAFVIKALARLPDHQGIAAMQSINTAVLNGWFLGVFMGTAAACALLILSSLTDWLESGAIFRLSGASLYLIGTLLVTIVCNVPRNDALAAVDAGHADGAARWRRYAAAWTAWNSVRTAAAIAASMLFILSLTEG